jgi:hypothetical protein
MCICATYSWSEVRILESGFIGSIWVCKHWDPQIHWQIMMLPIILAIDLRMFFFLGGEINISSFGTSQYFTTHDRSPHHLDMFWSWFGQASELAGDAASSGTNSRSGGLETEQPGRPRFFIFSKLAHEQLGGRHVSEASTTYRGESSERICMSKMMEKNLGKLKGGVLRWKLIGRDDGKMDENGKLHAQDGSTSVYMWIQIWIDMHMGNTLPSGFELYCTC